MPVTIISVEIEFSRDHLLEQCREPRRQLARLDHHPVAGGERADRGRKRELQRVVPGRDDADHPEWLRDQAVFRGPELQRGRDAPRRHPPLQVPGGVLDFGEQEQRLGDRRLDRRSVAEIGGDRLCEAGLVIGDRRAQPLQPIQTLIERRSWFRPRAFEHGMERVIQAALPGAFQRLVHGFALPFPLPFPWRFAR
jgi:hypothetical protein